MASLPIYTKDQLEEYLERIRYGECSIAKKTGQNTRLQHLEQAIQNDPLSALSELQRRHLAAIPWGNSGLHYSQHHSISLHAESLFEKIVRRRLDGYCMENSGIFYIILRSLGYRVYATGGRVSHAAATGVDNGLYLAFGHMILIVTINDNKYMVDVGFGNANATSPLPLKENTIEPCIAPAQMRVIKDSIPEFTDPDQRVWIYQTRHNPGSNWIPAYCFSETEFLPQDFRVMNFSVSQSPTSWFTQTFVCMRMILDEEEKEVIGQCVMSGKEVKKRVRGQTEILEVLRTEQDRVKALAKYFDMHLREEEIQGIQGMVSQLK